jgi:ubiquinone biosynthesis protein
MNRKNERERVREIISVFFKYGIKEGITNITNPTQVRMALEELGPTFIKIGQILSTHPELISEEYIVEFQKLQDNVRPEKFDDIKRIVESELKGNLYDFFSCFKEEPVASASMAQVHLARLKTGERVVVKVQRPRVKEIMLSDLAILKRLSFLMRLAPQGQVLNPSEVVKELKQTAENELDFLNEANNIKKFYENNKDIKYIACPKVYDQFTTPNIIVMEYIAGIKISNTSKLKKEGYDFEDIASKLTANYLKQVLEDGFFHADPHPGNILIRDNKIAYIDFGMMGTLGKGLINKFNMFIYGLATRNLDEITRAIIRIGVKKGQINSKKLYSEIEHIYNNYVDQSLFEIDLAELMDDIFKVCRNNNIAMPREVTMLMRGLMTLEGVVINITPDMNIMDIAVPYIRGRMLASRDYKQDIAEQVENLYNFSKVGLKIPVRMLELINSALAGKLKVQMEHTNLEKSIGELNKMVNRLVFSIVVASLIIGSSLVIRADAGPKMYGVSAFGFIGYVGTAVLAFWLLISILRSGKM